MEPIDPRIDPRLVPEGSKAVVVAEHQDEYRDLPSVVTPQIMTDAVPGAQQAVMRPHWTITRWTFTDDERAAIAAGEDVYLTIVGVPIRPVFLTVGPVDWT